MSLDPAPTKLTLECVKAAITIYPPDIQADLLWLYGYMADQKLSGHALGHAVGYDWTTLLRLFTGTYGADPANAIELIRRYRAQIAREQGDGGLIETPVTTRIRTACDRVLKSGGIGLVSGPTGRGKTLTITQWARANNHGRALYIDCPVGGGLRTLMDAIAQAANYRTRSLNGYQVRDHIERSLDRRNVLIIDEVGRLLPKGRGDVNSLEFLRRLSDSRGVGLILVHTPVFFDQMENGPLAGYLEQFQGRLEDPILIPRLVSRAEIRAILAAFRPDTPADLVARIQAYANAGKGGLRTCVRLLRQASTLAQSKAQTLDLSHFQTAVALRENSGRWED